MIDGYNTLLPCVYCDIERVFISLERKLIFCLWNVRIQSIALKLICLSGQSVYECHQPQNKNKCGLVNWSNITLLLVNNLYSGTAQTEERSERHYKVLNPSTSIMSPFSWHPTFSGGWGSSRTCCSLSGMVVSSVTGHWVWGSSFWGGGRSCSHLGRSLFGAACTKPGQALPSNVADRGLAVRPLWTVSQPSASFLPNEHIRHLVSHREDDQLQAKNTLFVFKKYFLIFFSVLTKSRFLTHFFHHRGCWLTGVCYRLRTFDSVCPAGAWVWESSCSQCRWGTTE